MPLVTLASSQIITKLKALKQLLYLGLYSVDLEHRKDLAGQFSTGDSQEVTARCGLGFGANLRIYSAGHPRCCLQRAGS